MTTLKRLAAGTFAMLAGLTLALTVSAGTAQAVAVEGCSLRFDYWSGTKTTPYDSGGADAWINGRCNGEVYYKVNFNAYGEELRLEDRHTDGRRARTIVEVYNGDNLKDTDVFANAGTETYNLGTPDGSGNIPEGYRVEMRLCVGDIGCSSDFAWGRA
ncbi:hypothetical protein [Salininema proteolyticum]|uniref:Secreted protein n=1 Tax=Salininema proteolyticum TaxID=1607685 RepID=A0ABV8U334_9ACTN